MRGELIPSEVFAVVGMTDDAPRSSVSRTARVPPLARVPFPRQGAVISTEGRELMQPQRAKQQLVF